MTLFFNAVSKYQRIILLLIGLIPILLYCYVILRFSSNVPFYDDFFWGFDYIESYFQKQAFAEKLKLLFAQHNQHRFVYFRAVLLALFQFGGSINFEHLIWIGNASLFGLLIIYIVVFRQLKLSWLYFLPVPFLLFQYQFMHNSIISYGVPNMSIIFFAVLTFYFACFGKPGHSYLIWIFGFLATFCNGNGIIVFFVAIILLLLQEKIQQAIYSVIAYGISLGIYFSGFQMNMDEITLNINTFNYAFQFLGAAFLTEINSWSVIMSILVISGIAIYFTYFFVGYIRDRFPPVTDKMLLFCLGVFMFLIGTAMITAIVRSINKVDLPNWYKNYSIVLVVTVYLFVLNFRLSKYLKLRFGIFFVLYGIALWYKSMEQNIESFHLIKTTLSADAINFRNHGYWTFMTAQEGKIFYRSHNEQTIRLIQKGWYNLPESALESQTFDESRCTKVTFNIVPSDIHFASLIEYELLYPKDEERESKERYGFIFSDSTKRVYFFGLTPTFNGVKGIIKYKSLFYDRGTFGVKHKYFKEALPAGHYRVGMVFIDKHKNAEWKISEQTIKVDNF